MYKREQREGAGLAYSLTIFLGADPPSAPDTRTAVTVVLVSASWDNSHLIEVPIMNLRRRRQDYSATLRRGALALLAPIAATFAMILLWFFG